MSKRKSSLEIVPHVSQPIERDRDMPRPIIRTNIEPLRPSYSDKLKDPQWYEVRNKVLSRDENTCRHCGTQAAQMDVHHYYYVSGREPWEYDLSALVTLCRDCHNSASQHSKTILSWEIIIGNFHHAFVSHPEIEEGPMSDFLLEFTDRFCTPKTSMKDVIGSMWATLKDDTLYALALEKFNAIRSERPKTEEQREEAVAS